MSKREVPDWDWTGIGVIALVIVVGLITWLVLTLAHAKGPVCPKDMVLLPSPANPSIMVCQ